MENLEFIEFETKYKMKPEDVHKFKRIVEEKFYDYNEFVYVESDDVYYVKGNDFLRYRYNPRNLNDRAELTFKTKLKESNNIIRKEVNLRVDGNSPKVVKEMANALGYERNFKISKTVHIYKFEEVTLAFYSVIEENGNTNHFMEFEVSEDEIVNYTKDYCWSIIRVHEEGFKPLGITARKRLKKSLFEMYRK